jgi:tetratricopeptide (TPR) repeat protein
MAVLGAVFFILSFVALIVWQGARHLRFATAWIGLTLLPTLVVPLIVLVNEHRLYLASVAGAWMAGWCIVYMARRRRGVALVVAAVYTIVTMSLTWQRNPTWADELSLWSDAAAKGPLMLKPRLRLADALVKQQRLPEAEAAYLAALALRPQHVAARTNLGRLYMQLGRYAQAEEQFFALLAVSPDAVAAQLNLAEIALRQSRWEAAASHYHNVLQYDDTGGVAQGKLGYIASQLGAPAAALQYYNEALELVRGRDVVRFLVHRGTVLKQLERLQEAEADYRRALKLDPAFVDAWYNLGNLYRDSRRLERAINAYERVIEIDTDLELARRASQQIQDLNPQSHQ